ncbi:hypothetical protein K440DRAFT_618477 [Wilcoxina mikolae CBS 423.85]|nr:hypothetical protein K440DRAFT_618477 [Wilcoxina mikolae CBS 423.85]
MQPLVVPFLHEICGSIILSIAIGTTVIVYRYMYTHRSMQSTILPSTAITPTAEQYSGLLTPPASPAPIPDNTNPYHDFLSSSLPAELSDAPEQLMQETLFGDIDPGLWAEVLSVGGSFSSFSEGIGSFSENDGLEMGSFMSQETGSNGN